MPILQALRALSLRSRSLRAERPSSGGPRRGHPAQAPVSTHTHAAHSLLHPRRQIGAATQAPIHPTAVMNIDGQRTTVLEGVMTEADTSEIANVRPRLELALRLANAKACNDGVLQGRALDHLKRPVPVGKSPK